MTKLFAGKVALVTGAARGIGAACAKALADEGADVAVSYSASAEKARAVVDAIRSKGVRGAAFKADQGDAEAAARLVASVVKELGGLDILVANAGAFAAGPSHADDTSAYDRMFAINTLGAIAGMRAAARLMRDGGRIIVMSSAAAYRTAVPGLADYAASKAALEGYARGLARDLGPRGITVNALGIGPIATDMNPEDTEFASVLRASTALGRYGKPEEVAAVACFLASSAASYVTGSVLRVDGGSVA